MKLCMFSPIGRELERGWPGRIDGDRVVQLAAQTLEAFFTGGGTAREHAEYPLDAVELRAPVFRPPSIRIFDASGDFVFGNTASIFGPDAVVPYPAGSRRLDFELDLAAMVGADGAIGGFTILNDWTARDLEGAKAKDFGSSVGPFVVTPDELGTAAVARVDGVEVLHAELAIDWEPLRARAGGNTILRPGDLLARGGLMGGLELAPGQSVELEIAGIGVLRNTVGTARGSLGAGS